MPGSIATQARLIRAESSLLGRGLPDSRVDPRGPPDVVLERVHQDPAATAGRIAAPTPRASRSSEKERTAGAMGVGETPEAMRPKPTSIVDSRGQYSDWQGLECSAELEA